MTKTELKISQKDNYAGNFGIVLRSSAIFYYRYDPMFTTTLSFMDYWSVKRELDVSVIASIRDLKGNLRLRELLPFDGKKVINYRPIIEDIETFEGSVELEVFATENMVIPYSAMMAIYETQDTITMVHSYSRIYSKHEMEEKRAITQGSESCWTIRDTKHIRSFCVFHNGYNPMAAQNVTLVVQNDKNETIKKTISLGTLAPYETIKFCPSDHIEDLNDFLAGKPGNASIMFDLACAFTRLLVGNETIDGKELQVTHSNFNYSVHNTDCLSDSGSALMKVVDATFANARVIVYPDRHEDTYHILNHNQSLPEVTNIERLEFDVEPGNVISFSTKSGTLPTRIVTAFTATSSNGTNIIPFECSLGVKHKETQKKRSHWGIIAADQNRSCRLIIQYHEEIFGTLDENAEISLSVYSSNCEEVKTIDLNQEQIQQCIKGIYIEALFPNIKDFLQGDFGYLYLTSSYGGLTCYTTLENIHGSICFEHTF